MMITNLCWRFMPSRAPTPGARQAGLTLLEVILTISILLMLSLAATRMIRSSIEMRKAVSEEAVLNHRLAVAMQKISNDLQHVFIINTLRPELHPGGRSTKAVFKVTRNGDNYNLAMTVMNHQPLVANAKQSDQAYVVYKIMEDKDDRNRTHLYRGQSKVIPESFDDDELPMELLAKDIKALKIYPWQGDAWSREGWNTDKSDWRNKLPRMVMVEIAALDEDLDEAGEQASDQTNGPVTTTVETIVYLPRSLEFKEYRAGGQNIKWF